MRIFWKGKAAAPESTIRTWADGKQHKKVGHTWITLGEGKSARPGISKKDAKASAFFDAAMGQTWAGLGILEHLEDTHHVSDFAGLKKLISTGEKGRAGKIFSSTKKYVDSLSIPTKDKQKAIDKLGRSLLILRDLYSGPKQKLMVNVRTKKGKPRYVPKEAPQPSFKASKIRSAREKLGGWSDMSKLPTMTQLNKMIRKGTAKITWGKPTAKKKWEVYQGLDDVAIPFKESAKGIEVKLLQTHMVKKRTRRTVTVELTIPYPHARQFLESHIKSARTRNNLIGQLTRSDGYKKAMR